MYIKDLRGNEFLLEAVTENNQELNGNQELSFVITPSASNDLFIDDISEMWTVVDYDKVEHRIVYFKERGKGNRKTVEVKAIPLFYDDFAKDRVYENINQHMTAGTCFNLLFKDTNFEFNLIDSFDAVQFEGFGQGDTKLELFQKALKRYKAEFEIVGHVVRLAKRIGRDTDFVYRHKIDASNVEKEVDATSFFTYAKGYGDYEDDEESGGYEKAKLIREYTSPLAEVMGIRHAPPIMDGRVKIKETMDEKLKDLVDNSLKISVTADIHDLEKQDYGANELKKGDRIFLIDERINFDEEVRIIEKNEKRDAKGNIIDLNLTFGSEGVVKRHQSNIEEITRVIREQINTVQIAANGKNKVFRGEQEPTEGMSKNDLWYKPVGDGETELYRFDGDIWVLEKVSAGLLGGQLDAENGDVDLINVNVSTLVGNISDFVKSYWNAINSRASIDGTRLRFTHDDGSYTELTADGLMHFDGTTRRAYHHRTKVIRFVCGADGQAPTTRWIPVGSEFNNKNWTASLAMSDSMDATSIEGTLHRIVLTQTPGENVRYRNGQWEVPVMGYTTYYSHKTDSRRYSDMAGIMIVTA